MAMTPYSGDTSVIGKLGTTPQERGLTTQQFKDKFDEGLKAFVEWFNLTHKTEFEAVQTDLATHKADNTTHNGFVGRYRNLSNFTDFNELTTPGLYHGVISGERLNEAVTISSHRRLTLQVTVNTVNNVYQELYYQDGASSIRHRRFYRQRTNATDWLPWFEIMTTGKDQTMTADLIAKSGTDYTARRVRNIILSTQDANPSMMQNGDIWIKYEE